MIAVSWSSATDVGAVRERNEDSLLACPPVFMVADGMGGHAAGDVASRLAVAQFAQLDGDAPPAIETVLAVLRSANDAILHDVRRHPSRLGMGTTAIVLAMVSDELGGDYWFAANLGDSRLYRYFDGVLEQVTVDHTEAQALRDSGGLTAEEARTHPGRHIVQRALGSDPMPEPDCWLMQPVSGERFLLCSDGLSGELSDATLRAELSAQGGPHDVAERLVRRAVAAGGRDNATAIVVDVGTADSDVASGVDSGVHSGVHSGVDETTSPRGAAPGERPAL